VRSWGLPKWSICRHWALDNVDILPDLKVQGFWIQTATAGIARVTSPSPTDNALPVATIVPKTSTKGQGFRPKFSVKILSPFPFPAFQLPIALRT
jgi:hypothetical protein